MSDNNISEVQTGNTGFPSQVNQYFNALKEVFYPRDAAGVVSDSAGSLGDSTRRWLNVFTAALTLGSASKNTTIQRNIGDTATEIITADNVEITTDGATSIKLSSNGAIIDKHIKTNTNADITNIDTEYSQGSGAYPINNPSSPVNILIKSVTVTNNTTRRALLVANASASHNVPNGSTSISGNGVYTLAQGESATIEIRFVWNGGGGTGNGTVSWETEIDIYR